MLSYLWNQLIRSAGVFVRTIRAFFTRRMTGITSRVRRVTNFSRNATKVATASVQSAVSVAQKPTKREDYVETSRLLISKALLLKIILGVIAAALILYFLVWPFILSNFLTARFVAGDSRISDWTGRVIVYADEDKTLPLYAGRLEDGVLQGRGRNTMKAASYPTRAGFRTGLRSGNGTAYADGVLVYEGQFSNGVYEGTGTAYEDGMRIYEGQFSDGVYEGRGELYEDGILRYAGSFQSGEASGDGTSYSASGTLAYKGQFSGGLPEGTGTAYDEAGQVLYRGEFAGGVYSGSGTLYLAEGGTLEADFADGKPQGVVQWKRDGRLYYEGEWSGAQASGFGTLYSRSGAALYEGQFLGGTLDGSWLLGLTAEELREVLERDSARNVSTAGGFLIVSDSPGPGGAVQLPDRGDGGAGVHGLPLPAGRGPRLPAARYGPGLPSGLAGGTRRSGAASCTSSRLQGWRWRPAPTRPRCLPRRRAGPPSLYTADEEAPASVLLSWSRLESMPTGLDGTSDGGSAGGDGRMEAFLESLDLMETQAGGTQATQNPYYGTEAVSEALSACENAGAGPAP